VREIDNNKKQAPEFKNDVLTAQIKFGVIAPVIQGLYPDATKTAYYKRVAEIPLTMPDGRQVKFSYNTYEKWEQAFRKNGYDGLAPKKRSDAGVTRKISERAISEIYRLKEKFPKASATLIYNKLIVDGYLLKKDTSLCTIQRFFRKNNLKKAFDLDAKDRKAFEEEYPCMMYQSDTSHTLSITEGSVKRKTYLIHVVDDNTRAIVGARFFYEDNAYNFQQVLKEAVARFGLCTKLYVDSGSPYKNGQLSRICIDAGIVELHTPIRDGSAKGKVERSFKTAKETWLYGFDPSDVSSLEELNSELRNYVNMRNNTNNRNIGCTPMERYRKNIDKIRFPESQEWLNECFMNRVTRKVYRDSTVSIDKISYDVPMQFIGDWVEIRYLPDNMANAYIYYQNKHYPIRRTDRIENSRTKRSMPSIDYSRKEQ
jgi:transposase InsO family protein